MNYKTLSPQTATELLQHDVPNATYHKFKSHIIDPVNTLYWSDRLGNLEHAVKVQALPQDTPKFVAETLIDEEEEFCTPHVTLNSVVCPGCGIKLYELVSQSASSDSYLYVSEMQDVHPSHGIEVISDPGSSSRYWQADPDGGDILCAHCTHDGINGTMHRGRGRTGKHALRGFCKSTKTLTQYSSGGDSGTVITKDHQYNARADALPDTDNQAGDSYSWTDGSEFVPGNLTDFLRAYAVDGVDNLERYLLQFDWTLLSRSDVIAATHRDDLQTRNDDPFRTKEYGLSKDERAVKEYMKTLGMAATPHDDIEFPYFISSGRRALIPKDRKDEFLVTVINGIIDHRANVM